MIRPLFTAALAAFALLLSPLCRGALAAESQVIDGIAAIVNGDVITYSQVRGLSGPRERLLHSQFKGEELAKQIKAAREAALKDLIDRQLIVQSFAKGKVRASRLFRRAARERYHPGKFRGDRQTFIKTLAGAELFAERIQERREGKNHRPGHAEQEREADHGDSAGENRRILHETPGGIHGQGAGQAAHDHDPDRRGRRECGGAESDRGGNPRQAG